MTNQLTHQERIQALTDKINELLGGEIKKLQFGCKLRDKAGLSSLYLGGGGYPKVFYKDSLGIVGDYIPDEFKILGRPIMATDILRALKVLKPNDVFAFDNNGYLFVISGDDCGHTYTRDIDEYPLDKCLADFPESRIQSLYKLFFE